MRNGWNRTKKSTGRKAAKSSQTVSSLSPPVMTTTVQDYATVGNVVTIGTVEGDFIVRTNGSDISTKTEALKRIHGGVRPGNPAIDNDEMFEAARDRAAALCREGRQKDASRAFKDAFEHEQIQENRRREIHQYRCQRLLEEALSLDENAMNYEAAVAVLFRIAEIKHPSDCNARWEYLLFRSSQYEERGVQRGDNIALRLSCIISRKVAMEKSKN
jgi:hypothetical protein